MATVLWATPVGAAGPIDLSITEVVVSQGGADELVVAVNVDKSPGPGSDNVMAGPAVLTATLPAGASFVSGPDCVAALMVVTCQVGPATEPVRLSRLIGGTFRVRIDLNNVPTDPVTGSVTGLDADPDLTNNSFSTPIQLGVDLAVDSFVLRSAAFQPITAEEQLDTAGTEMRLFTTVRSVGVSTTLWFPTAVSYVLPTGLQFVRGERCTAVGQTVTCVVGPDHMTPGRPDTLVGDGIYVTLNAGATGLGGPISATVQGDPADPVLANNAATLTIAPAPPTTAPPTTDPAVLPATGRDTGWIAVWAAAAIAIGSLMLLIAARQQRRRPAR